MDKNSANEISEPFRILSLDGGGSKGFYTLGVLEEIEALIDCHIYEKFNLIYGTSTGSIIAALLAIGKPVDEVYKLYKKHVPTILNGKNKNFRSETLAKVADEIFKDEKFDTFKTMIGIVTAKWSQETPMIFKSHINQVHGRSASFEPGYGCTISEAVQASCSAYPYFNLKTITTLAGDKFDLIDGGYCANNPTLYAIADAVNSININPDNIKVVSIGVGSYPVPPKTWIQKITHSFVSVQLLQKTLEINTKSMEQLSSILFNNIDSIRISDSFVDSNLATNFLEDNLEKLDTIRLQGKESFAKHEINLKRLLIS